MKRSLPTITLALATFFIVNAGLSAKDGNDLSFSSTAPATQLAPAPAAIETRILGTSVENRPIECTILGTGPDTTLILAGIHGNEHAGVMLAQKLTEYLQKNPDILKGRKVVIMAKVNPDGLEDNSRFNARRVDINRNFDTINRKNNRKGGRAALSEPETQAIQKILILYPPKRIISLHQVVTLHGKITKGMIDSDGPGRPLAEHIAGYCELPVNKWGSPPGSLGSFVNETLGVPLVTIELPKNVWYIDAHKLWKQYGHALLAGILFPDFVPGVPPTTRTSSTQPAESQPVPNDE